MLILGLQVHADKRYVIAQAGITLETLHAELANNGLAMIIVGSISDQTLGGIVTTATHGSGINYGVISTHVMGLELLLADGSRVFCSRQERPDLFIASICGLGSTGLILTVTLEVEPAFRLKEVRQSIGFHECVRSMDSLVTASEHVRFWWFPAADTVRIFSADRTAEVSPCAQIAPIAQLNPFAATQSSGKLAVGFAFRISRDSASPLRGKIHLVIEHLHWPLCGMAIQL